MNNKKVLFSILIIVLCIFFIIISVFKKEEPVEIRTKLLKDFEYYQKIDIDNINNLTISTYTEAGGETENIEDKEEIKSLYNRLGNIKVSSETTISCEDNSKIYNFFGDDETYRIEVECEALIFNNKRYLIVE